MRKASSMLLWLLAAVMLVPAANASILQYEYTGSLQLLEGPDVAGLAGASFRLEAKFTLFPPAIYADDFGGPPVIGADSASFTISGATVAANNGVYDLPDAAFLPAVLVSTPLGEDVLLAALSVNNSGSIGLPVGGSLLLHFLAFPTATGKAAVPGGPVLASDFGPTSATNVQDWAVTGPEFTLYNPIGGSINAFIVPEPATTTLVGVALIGLAGRRLLRKRT